MTDPAYKETEKILKELEKKIAGIYKKATEEVQDKLDDYLRRFAKKDQTWQDWVLSGKKTQDEYNHWRIGQIAIGERWAEMRDNLAHDMHNANKIARSVAYGYMPEVYAVNHNYATFEVESQSMIDTSYTLYNREAVEKILREDPDFLPSPGSDLSDKLAVKKDIRWNNKLLQSAILQAILQGEAIPDIATRVANAVGSSNRKSAIRAARTMTTGVQNAGRRDSYIRARDKGIEMRQMWVAVHDNRTRHAHRELDGQIVDVGKPFHVDGEEIMYPGDPNAPGYLIYNCRCGMNGVLKGYELDPKEIYRKNNKLGGMTYEEWRKGHSVSDPITKQDEIRKRMKGIYISEYKKR